MLSRVRSLRPTPTHSRIALMAAHITKSSLYDATTSNEKTYSINDLPKSTNFTTKLPPDTNFPTPSSSHAVERSELGPRLVKGSLYTYVRPEPPKTYEVLAVSPAALQTLAIDPSSIDSQDFHDTVSGSKILTWDEAEASEANMLPEDQQRREQIYPWAQCYGGYQFGQWAGQLGDGRAISLFEATNPNSDVRYELQLKGAGRTPYSRFADGKAVLRSSIREFVVSENLHALGIPSTRALALTFTPEDKARRETIEPGAIVTRFAQSWLRIGTFDLIRSRGDRALLRKLSTYVAEDVFGGWKNLPGALASGEMSETAINPDRNISKDTVQGSDENEANRFTRLYREIVRRNAKTVAHWQAYAFTNGVLNTDNTSIFGLSVDFGPFAFLDNFDPSYTPNHDDHQLRYAYRNQPSIIWWNLVRLGESLGELIGAGARCDDDEFVNQGVSKVWADELVKRAENLITQAGQEFRALFMAEYKRLMTARLGLKQCKDSDFDVLFSELLDTLQALELDFNHTFRKLSHITTSEIETEEQRKEIASRFFHSEGLGTTVSSSEDEARLRIAKWLEQWRHRVLEDWSQGNDAERLEAMKKVNPKVNVAQCQLCRNKKKGRRLTQTRFTVYPSIVDFG
jgi:uncharacterized protein YdiU (UPF0061 family)